MSNVLLYGGGLQVLSIARSLKESGYNVYAVNDDISLIKHCRYIMKYTAIPCGNVKQLLQQLLSWEINVIIPMEDQWAESLSINKSIIEEHTSAKCAVCNIDVFRLASDKTRLLSFCRLHNLPHPKTAIIDDNIDSVIEYVGFPSLIKPSISEGARGIVLVDSKEELCAIIPSHLQQYGECSLQEYIKNDHYYNVMLYRCIDGTFANHVVTNISRFYPIKGGSSSLCTTIENTKLVDICKQVLNKLEWVGFADFDVLEKDDGDYRIIEINPRVPASVRAAAISGVNFGNIIVSDILTGSVPSYKYTPGKQLRYLGLDVAWFISSPMRFKTKPSWFNFFGKSLYYQEGGYKDWKAMLASIYIGVKKMLSPSFRRQKSGMN